MKYTLVARRNDRLWGRLEAEFQTRPLTGEIVETIEDGAATLWEIMEVVHEADGVGIRLVVSFHEGTFHSWSHGTPAERERISYVGPNGSGDATVFETVQGFYWEAAGARQDPKFYDKPSQIPAVLKAKGLMPLSRAPE